MTTKDPQNPVITDFGALVETADGSLTIRHPQHGQDFHSSEGARFEAWELYIVASGLWKDLDQNQTGPIAVLDVGMGLGYNACATVAAWLKSPGAVKLHLVSLEIDSKLVEALASLGAPWIAGWDELWSAGLTQLQKQSDDRWTAKIQHPGSGETLSWTIVIGDAAQIDLKRLAEETGIKGFQYVWQDPFTPELNPTMWSSHWFANVKKVALPQAKLMTYSVSRVVKDALTEACWSPERFRTPGKKRHWLRATNS